MSHFALLPPWLALLAQFALGRLALSMLPGGRPGGHAPRELFATWGASHVLGQLILTGQLAWCAAAGLDLPAWLHFAPWGVLLLGRVSVLPGSTTPRHTPLEPAPTTLGWIGRLGLSLALIQTLREDSLQSAANLAATSSLLLEAMRGLRRRPDDRAWLVAAFAWTPAVRLGFTLDNGPALAALALTAMGGLAWTRRADARGLAMAAAGALGLAAVHPALLWVAPLAALALVGVTARPGRPRATLFVLGAGLLLLVPTLFLRHSAPGVPEPSDLLDGYLPWTLLGITGLAATRRESTVQRPGRELMWLLLLYCAVWLGHALADSGAWPGLIWGTIPAPHHLLLPICALAACGTLREGPSP